MVEWHYFHNITLLVPENYTYTLNAVIKPANKHKHRHVILLSTSPNKMIICFAKIFKLNTILLSDFVGTANNKLSLECLSSGTRSLEACGNKRTPYKAET